MLLTDIPPSFEIKVTGNEVAAMLDPAQRYQQRQLWPPRRYCYRWVRLWDGCDDYFPSAANTDRHEYIVNVQFDCALAYSQFTRDFLIGKALLNQHRNLLLAGGQYAAPFCGFEDIYGPYPKRVRDVNKTLFFTVACFSARGRETKK
jgi:hypothetical protein